jgi:hypothetical protein
MREPSRSAIEDLYKRYLGHVAVLVAVKRVHRQSQVSPAAKFVLAGPRLTRRREGHGLRAGHRAMVASGTFTPRAGRRTGPLVWSCAMGAVLSWGEIECCADDRIGVDAVVSVDVF